MNRQIFLHQPGQKPSELDQIVRPLQWYAEHKTVKVISIEDNQVFTVPQKTLRAIGEKAFPAIRR